MEKVTLTKAQVEALEAARSRFSKGNSQLTDEYILYCHANNYNLNTHVSINWGGDLRPLAQLSLETLACALYSGYEVEQTPHERLKEYYDHASMRSEGRYSRMIVEKTLKILGIEVEGINK